MVFETVILPSYTSICCFFTVYKRIFVDLLHLNQDRQLISPPVYSDSLYALISFCQIFQPTPPIKTPTCYSGPKSGLLKASEIFNSQVTENVISEFYKLGPPPAHSVPLFHIASIFEFFFQLGFCMAQYPANDL